MLNSANSLRALLLLYALGLVWCTKYYVTRSNSKKRLDEPKKVSKDPIHTSNSNTYFVEDGYGYESHELGDYGDHHDAYDYKGGYNKDYNHRYVSVEKKHSKFFGDELSFVIVVVTLTVFFGILSSLLIPLTLMLANGGANGLFGLGGLGGLNGVLPVAGLGGIAPGVIGRRRRSVTSLETKLDSALTKFSQQQR